jgi:hypothetical protein
MFVFMFPAWLGCWKRNWRCPAEGRAAKRLHIPNAILRCANARHNTAVLAISDLCDEAHVLDNSRDLHIVADARIADSTIGRPLLGRRVKHMGSPGFRKERTVLEIALEG